MTVVITKVLMVTRNHLITLSRNYRDLLQSVKILKSSNQKLRTSSQSEWWIKKKLLSLTAILRAWQDHLHQNLSAAQKLSKSKSKSHRHWESMYLLHLQKGHQRLSSSSKGCTSIAASYPRSSSKIPCAPISTATTPTLAAHRNCNLMVRCLGAQTSTISRRWATWVRCLWCSSIRERMRRWLVTWRLWSIRRISSKPSLEVNSLLVAYKTHSLE